MSAVSADETTDPTVRDGHRVVILGGGPGGYEAALVARRLGAQVTVVERHGLGGAAVLTDVVPSKTLIATAEWLTGSEAAPELGVREAGRTDVDLAAVNARVLALAAAQSADIRARLEREGARIVTGDGRLDGPGRVVVRAAEGGETVLDADTVLVAVGATPRTLPTAVPDGERILTWTQLYRLDALPRRLIVVGSGVTGAEFAGAYHALGCDVVLVSSRERVLPGEDEDAAALLEGVFRGRGMQVMSRSRAAGAERTADGVVVTLADGRVVEGSHVLLAVGAVPATAGLGLEEAGVALSPSGHVVVDKVSRTTARGVYAAGDCTGVLPLASVAAQQGRIAMAHALGDAVQPLRLGDVAANIFTSPEIATVGYSERQLREGGVRFVASTLPLARNPRAKMLGMRDGFVKLFAHPEAGVVLGGVVVSPRASELIFPITLAVAHRLTVDDVASAFTIYPSLSGSIAEGARVLHGQVSPGL
ncbi:NAD(P)H-quinone dehydrogenase [Xylanimonas ulmi]|uniref:Dihydrolipoamide dehydrogenase n=1 Tax=Xylanimonas ulmi TaxID=228973 RepID=A0A4Q7M1L5_9MICO|nr:NAD(P)H-quinone dehydrogenase [Xylanibacterium ulmi]RZS61725.1 dihydrolipoamide dehydrogenase [Xylanibacterium ulmi]